MAYGIDLGTTNSVISKLSNKPPHTPIILKSKNNYKTTPSIVNFNNNEINIGHEAKPYLITNPQNTITSIKRLIGKKYNEIENDINSYKLVPHKNNDAWVEVNGIKKSPSEISSLILKKLVSYIKGDKKIDIVITVPAYFNESQRIETKKACQLAGLNVLKIINEPTAAALAYGINTKKEGIIAVYDLGGGTFDISILKIKDGIFEVLSTNGNTKLGGDDIDNKLKLLLKEKIEKENNKKIRLCFERRLKFLAENIKKDLSINKLITIKLPNKIFKGNGLSLSDIKYDKLILKEELKDNEVSITISQEELTEITKPFIEKTRNICLKALKDAKINKLDINDVLLVGGQTKMPFIRNSIKEIFGRSPSTHIDPDEAVAKGAALQAGIIKNIIDDTILLDVNSLSLGIETIGGLFSPIIPRNTPLPTKMESEFTTSLDNQESVDIRVFQGESNLVKDNMFLGEFKLKNIEKRNAGVPRIKVTFSADTNGLVKVEGEENGKIIEMEIIPSTGLTNKEIEDIIKKGEIYRDNKKKGDQ